jgi:hypothetical protein
LRAGYGEPLRRFLVENSVFEEIVDFGHAPIFEDADTFPCIVALRKRFDPPQPPLKIGEQEGISPASLKSGEDVSLDPPQPPLKRGEQEGISPGSGEKYVQVCPVPREKLADINLTQYVQQESYPVAWSRFSGDAWSLEQPEVEALMEKIQRVGIPLKEFAGVKPYRGILTGFNEAFLIDEATKNRLVKADPKSAEVIKPFLRGRDIKRWSPDWQNLWIILLKSSGDYTWPWSQAENKAEEVFNQTFPSVYQHLKPLESKLRKRQDKGRYWWELRSCAYYQSFEHPKIIYQVIQTLPQYAFDDSGLLGNDKTFILPKSDLCLLGWLNSPIIWWYGHRVFTKMLSGSISPMGYLFETLPIAPPTDQIREQVEPMVSRLIEITQANQTAYKEVLDWLQVEQQIDKPGEKLEEFANLEEKDFIQEVKKRKPKSSGGLSPAALKELRQVYQDYAPDIQSRQAEALTLEHRLSDLVNQAYGLTPEEIDLMWKTAPPRMPIAPKK